jgi:hypothetical protein
MAEDDETLETRSLRQFDYLVGNGELLWKETTLSHHEAEPFDASPPPDAKYNIHYMY